MDPKAATIKLSSFSWVLGSWLTAAGCAGGSMEAGADSNSGDASEETGETSMTAGISTRTSTSTESATTADSTSESTSGSVSGMGASESASPTSSTEAPAETSNDASTGTPPLVDGSRFDVTTQLASDVDSAAPGTVGIVTWSFLGDTGDTIEEAQIEFGLESADDMVAPVDLEEPGFRTLLLGLKPSQTYHFRISATVGGVLYVSDDYTLETGPPTTIVDIGDFEIHDETTYERGFILASYWQGNGASVAFILDADGEIVWWYESNTNGIARARMSEDGKNMWIVPASNQGGPIERVTMDALDGEVYMGTSGSHDLTPVEGATMAYLDYGESDCDSIFEIDPSGITTEVFESDDVLMSNGCHGNALRYSQAEDVYTFSDVQQDILVVSRSGDLQWRLSELLDEGIAAYGGRQHGHQLLDDSIVVFANGQSAMQGSMAVEYDLQGQEIWRHAGGHFTANLGDVQRLPGGNTLMTYSNDSIVEQVDNAGDVVMEFDGAGSRIGYTLWRESLYGPPTDILQ